MKNFRPIVISIFIFILVAGGLWFWRSKFDLKQVFQASSQKTIYYCPMHPTYTSDRPGNCPICGMKLVKRESSEQAHKHATASNDVTVTPREFTIKELMSMKPGEICLLHKCKMGTCMMAMTEEIMRLGKCPHCGEDLGVIIKEALPKGYASIELSTDKQQMIGVRTATVEKQRVTKAIRTVGRIAYDPELYQAQQEFAQAVQAKERADAGTIDEIKEQADQLVESAKIKLRLLGLSDELIQEVSVSKKPDRSLLYSDAGGTVWLYAPVYEYEIPVVKVGDQLEVEAPAIPGNGFQGKIRSIDSVLDPVTRSVRVRAVLDNPEGLLKPEMYVNATLQIDLGEVLTVPESAVFKTGEKNIIFVAKENGAFEPRHVILGVKSEGFQTVQSGVSEGEKVVTSGNFLIDSESRLKAALEGMGSEGGHQHGG